MKVNNNVKLGFELAKLQSKYYYDEIIAFLKGTSNDCMHYSELKPFYDKYGYETVNKTLLALEDMKG